MQALWEEGLDAAEAAEVHWSTGTILATFFAASLISAVFFGLGYSFGRGGTTKPVVAMVASSAATAEGTASRSATAPTPVSDRLRQRSSNGMGTVTAHPGNDSAKRVAAAPVQMSKIQARHAAVVQPKAKKTATIAAGTRSSAGANGAAHYMVQVGAIGNHKDARVLVSKLRKHGFHAGIYPSKHDKFLHVQIGPFATTEQAQAVRHHVIASGYHAIVKHAS